MNLKDKIVLVTGASGGIGSAIAVELAKRHAIVLVHYRNNKDGAKYTLQEVEKYSQGAIFCADLCQETEVKKLFEDIKDRGYSQITGLVNNAGDMKSGEFDDMQLWENQMQNLFFSQIYTSNTFIKTTEGKGRKIVNISSICGLINLGSTDFPQYSVAKAAINSFTLLLAKKYAPEVLVNAVAPGYTLTPPWEKAPQEEKDICVGRTKIKRFIQPEEIASAVCEILQNDAITGEVLRVDGGVHLVNL